MADEAAEARGEGWSLSPFVGSRGGLTVAMMGEEGGRRGGAGGASEEVVAGPRSCRNGG